MSASQQMLIGSGGPAVGQTAFTTPGTHYWTVPSGVSSVCVVCVGAGGFGEVTGPKAGGGGALAYANNVAVTPGSVMEVVVGAVGSNYDVMGGSSRFSSGICEAGGGHSAYTALPGAGGTVIYGTGSHGGDGGNGVYASMGAYATGGGGGAGGYSGPGGDGSAGVASYGSSDGEAGTGGAGGGGAGGSVAGPAEVQQRQGGRGGGVGLLGQGASGAGGAGVYAGNGGQGGDGSGGAYGGGSSLNTNGGGGAVRIIWGEGRSFPSTNTGNL